MNPKIAAAVIFLLSYALLVSFKAWKSQILWLGIGSALILSLIHARDILFDINWNVMGIFAGTLVLAEFFVISRVPEAVAAFLVKRSRNVGVAFLYVCLFSSFLSVFIENVAVVLIVAPIALELARKMDVSPVPAVIGIAIASNLQGTATLIGDPPSMILANYQKMNFNDFFIYHNKPGIFFAVEAGAVVSMLVLYFIFRKHKKPIAYAETVKVKSFKPTFLILLMILGLTLSSLVDPDFKWFGGFICIFLAMVCVLSSSAERSDKFKVLASYDWGTTAFLAGVFVIVGMLERSGLINDFAQFLGGKIGSNPGVSFLVIVWGSVALSAVIDNVPYITAMIPVVQTLSRGMGIAPELLVFGLLIGACLGGNITPVGASANIVSTGILRKNGYSISFWEFMRIGAPFTFTATAVGTLVIYLVWS